MPVRAEYQKAVAVFEEINASYEIIKTISDEKEGAYLQDNADLQALTAAHNRVKIVATQLVRLYDSLITDKTALADRYKELSANYAQTVTDYAQIKVTFTPLKHEYYLAEHKYQELQAAQASAQKITDKVAQEQAEVQGNLSDIKSNLSDTASQVTSFQTEFTNVQTTVNEASKITDLARKDLQANKLNAKALYDRSSEVFTALLAKYQHWMQAYQVYDEQYQTLLDNYANIKYDQLMTNFEQVLAEHQAAELSNQQEDENYQVAKTDYDGQVKYLAQIKPFLTKGSELKAEIDDLQVKTGAQIAEVNHFLTEVTFPINEATNQNYVDEFNVNDIILKKNQQGLQNKPQLAGWNEQYTDLKADLKGLLQELKLALVAYQDNYTSLLAVGGSFAELNQQPEAIVTMDVDQVLLSFEERVTTLTAAYQQREQSFAALVNKYRAFLGAANQLTAVNQVDSQSKDGMQGIIGLINALANYTDSYNQDHLNVRVLADWLELENAQLAQPQSADKLKAMVEEHYGQALTKRLAADLTHYAEGFAQVLLKYNQRVEDLQAELTTFQANTGISIAAINIKPAVMPTLEVIEVEYQTIIQKNLRLLIEQVRDNDSLLNGLKRVKGFARIAEAFSIEASDKLLAFPEQKVLVNKIMNLAPVEFMEFSLPAEPVAPEKTAYKVAMPVTPEQLPIQAKRVAAIA
ncbi:hypothetical protein WOSG25_130480 [Weissella oryzae SG25]|uniref:Uncharacterized protein n=2 Tax=Weissella TaxID=46255 RepID=A0A069D2Q4_WEIOS|nr:hypothetical protein WOSG25_130480 [Weissella oryzae SG25]